MTIEAIAARLMAIQAAFDDLYRRFWALQRLQRARRYHRARATFSEN